MNSSSWWLGVVAVLLGGCTFAGSGASGASGGAVVDGKNALTDPDAAADPADATGGSVDGGPAGPLSDVSLSLDSAPPSDAPEPQDSGVLDTGQGGGGDAAQDSLAPVEAGSTAGDGGGAGGDGQADTQVAVSLPQCMANQCGTEVAGCSKYLGCETILACVAKCAADDEVCLEGCLTGKSGPAAALAGMLVACYYGKCADYQPVCGDGTCEGSETTLTCAKDCGAPTCPTAVVIVQEGEEVVPQTLLHLIGTKSKAAPGRQIKKYLWKVAQPVGSTMALSPNPTFPNPTLQANTAGEYQFCLEVWDDQGEKSCQQACTTVVVVPNNAVHVELLWDTPADPDQTDSGPAAGADLDLHFAHQLAKGPDLDCDGTADPWFDNPFDTFWFNPTPNWGSNLPADNDDPTLDLDDTDGAGPENLNMVNPEGTTQDPVSYAIGVHYWNDHGYGTSFATVAIYVQGALAVYVPKVKMATLDLWYVGKINWPNTVTGGAKEVFTPCYQTGPSCKGGKMWVAKGDRCIKSCYENKVFVAGNGGAAPATCKQVP